MLHPLAPKPLAGRNESLGLFSVQPLLNLSSIWKGTDELAFEDPGFQSLSVADSLQLVHLGEGSDLFIMFIRICTLILMQGLWSLTPVHVYWEIHGTCWVYSWLGQGMDFGGKWCEEKCQQDHEVRIQICPALWFSIIQKCGRSGVTVVTPTSRDLGV